MGLLNLALPWAQIRRQEDWERSGEWDEMAPRAAQRSVLLALGVLATVGYVGMQVLTFVAAPAPNRPELARQHSPVALRARGGGEYDVSDADIEAFYQETISGGGGDPPKGTIVAELIVKFFHGEFTPQGSGKRST